LTLIPGQAGKALTWDVTVICPLAVIRPYGSAGHRHGSSSQDSQVRYLFQPIAVESLGPINCSAVAFLRGLGRQTAEVSGKIRDGSFLYQQLNMLIQCFNAVLLHDCFVDDVAGHSS